MSTPARAPGTHDEQLIIAVCSCGNGITAPDRAEAERAITEHITRAGPFTPPPGGTHHAYIGEADSKAVLTLEWTRW